MFVRENRDYLDWWLMQRFPGRTLEELDGMDWLRLRRVLEVGKIVDVEMRRDLYLQGKLTAEALRPDEWQAIRRHDRLYEQWESERLGQTNG